MIRRAETDSDFAAYAACWAAVWPEDPISADFVRERVAREPERLYLLAEEGSRVVATGCVDGRRNPAGDPWRSRSFRSGAGKGSAVGSSISASITHAHSTRR